VTRVEDAKKRRKRMIELRAAGVKPREIAAETGLSVQTVQHHLAKPEAQEALTAARDRAKAAIMRRAEKLVDGTLDVVQASIEDKDAKSLYLSTQAAVNLDKLTASASGEAARVEVSGQVNVDVRAILAKLTQAP
jgi:predicted transcriptional regulator